MPRQPVVLRFVGSEPQPIESHITYHVLDDGIPRKVVVEWWHRDDLPSHLDFGDVDSRRPGVIMITRIIDLTTACVSLPVSAELIRSYPSRPSPAPRGD